MIYFYQTFRISLNDQRWSTGP